MSIKFYQLIFLFILTNSAYCCTCYVPGSFSLSAFDRFPNIVEMKIIKELPSSETKDPFGFEYSGFEIEVLEVFKGKIELELKKLSVYGGFSSCDWIPKAGSQYLFYLGENNSETEGMFATRMGCQRRFVTDDSESKSEIEALRIIRDKTNGKVKIDQTILLEEPGKQNYYSVIGKMKNGKRHGKWILAEPLNYSRSDFSPQSKVIEIKYRLGEVVSVIHHPYKEERDREKFAERWNQYYESLIQPTDNG